ncbi:GHMP kinase [Streptomyces sp. UNOC14_S4]|nr:GHMP kinase [Streptomyces sp. UNOC14_S4]
MTPATHRTVSGTGHAPCHHGEILQGVFLDSAGRRCAALVTLPMSGPGSHATFTADPGAPPRDLTVFPPGRTKALRAASLTAEECARRRGTAPCGGVLTLTGDIPVGLGMGSSTSDVIAVVRAVADAFGTALPPDAVARLAVRAELASDPLMLDGRPVLFAQREGRVLEVLGPALPPAVVVGCALGGPVDTLSLPAQSHGEKDVRAYARLLALLRRAVAEGDTGLLGHVATASARRAQRVLRHEKFDTLTDIADHVGAVGVQIAHSGTVAGLLFSPTAPGLRHRLRQCARALDSNGIPVTRTFTTSTTVKEPPEWTSTSRNPSAAPTSYASTTGSSACASRP